jgi:hypothetical protein
MVKTPITEPTNRAGGPPGGTPNHGINRRGLGSLLLPAAVEMLACTPRKREVLAAVRRLDERQSLCILGLDGAAITADGRHAGKLDLPGVAWDAAVSPDGACVAYTTRAEGPLVFVVEDYPRSSRTLRFDGGFAAQRGHLAPPIWRS